MNKKLTIITLVGIVNVCAALIAMDSPTTANQCINIYPQFRSRNEAVEYADNNTLEKLQECGICSEDFNRNEHARVFLSCHHQICATCLNSIGRTYSPKCPFCRATINMLDFTNSRQEFNVDSLPRYSTIRANQTDPQSEQPQETRADQERARLERLAAMRETQAADRQAQLRAAQAQHDRAAQERARLSAMREAQAAEHETQLRFAQRRSAMNKIRSMPETTPTERGRKKAELRSFNRQYGTTHTLNTI